MVTMINHQAHTQLLPTVTATTLNLNMVRGPVHKPVLLQEAINHLAVQPGGIYVDATAGEGGHTLAILRASAPLGFVLGIDLDPHSLAQATQRLKRFGSRCILTRGNYAQMDTLAKENGLKQANGILLDLGLSSLHLDVKGRGFSFQQDDPLDMRYDQDANLTAAHIVNTYSEKDLGRLIFQFGEESRAKAIARAIVLKRPIGSTNALGRLVAATVGPKGRWRTHPATRTFQAIRIAVNRELDHLQVGLLAAIKLLQPTGRLVVISYHSLEDRLVKMTLVRESAQCVCPPGFPSCVCEHKPTMKIINRRVIRATIDDVTSNPRGRSARMRVAERL
jgi:16S rRNA (cytosine1402-N4)-methyltransferase